MPTIDLVRLYTGRLQKAGIKYMVTGSVACIVYGEPRLTHDVDLVVEMSVNQIAALQKAFPPDEFFCPSPETMTIDIGRPQRGSFNIVHHETGFKADFYLVGKDPIQRWGLSRSEMLDIGGEKISIAPADYVIIRKLEFYREGGSEKHIRDIVGVLRKWPELKDSRELLIRLENLGLQPQWKIVLEDLQRR